MCEIVLDNQKRDLFQEFNLNKFSSVATPMSMKGSEIINQSPINDLGLKHQISAPIPTKFVSNTSSSGKAIVSDKSDS